MTARGKKRTEGKWHEVRERERRTSTCAEKIHSGFPPESGNEGYAEDDARKSDGYCYEMGHRRVLDYW